jgi:hypothetical protein
MNNFSFIHLIALVVGGIIILMVKRKYKKIRISELILILILYFILVFLFTDPVLNLARKLISQLQLQ